MSQISQPVLEKFAERVVAAFERMAMAAEATTIVMKKVDAVIESAGGVQGIQEKLKFLDSISKGPLGWFGKKK